MEAARVQNELKDSEPMAGEDRSVSRSSKSTSRSRIACSDMRPPSLRLSQAVKSTAHTLQAKLTINEPGDQYEQEADRVAEQVMRLPESAIGLQRKCACDGLSGSGETCKECAWHSVQLQRRVTSENSSSTIPAPSLVQDVLRLPGQLLDQSTRRFFESRFNQDFGDVRVHSDARAAESARSINALAYTVNHNVVFGRDRYAPHTTAGRQLLAHELAHVVQQRQRTGGSETIQPYRYRGRPTPQGLFTIEASASQTIPLSQSVTYTVTPTAAAPAGAYWLYRFWWLVRNDPTTYDRYSRRIPNLPRVIVGPQNSAQWIWTLYSVYPGTHHITVTITRMGTPVETIDFEQTVTDDGRTALHSELIRLSGQTTVDPGVREWTTSEFAAWMNLRASNPSLASAYIHTFKAQWVRAYRRVIIAAANRFDLPPALLAGVVYTEVGGDPTWIDSVAHAVRQIVPGTSASQLTSFGNVSTQVRRGAETLGYDPARLVSTQESRIIESLENPRQNIFIAASHLADLRDIDFPNTHANDMTFAQMRVTATRFNRGPNLTIEQIRQNLSYGNSIINRLPLLSNLLSN